MKRRLGFQILLAGLMFLFFCLAVWNQNRLRECTSDMATAVLSDPMSRKDTDQILEKENSLDNPSSFVFWGEKKEERIENKDFERSTLVTLVNTGGNPSLLFGNEGALDSEDLNGCLIDRQTAVDLFGSEKALGEKITCGQRVYVVRKVIPESDPVLVVQAYGDEKNMQMVTLLHQEGTPDAEMMEHFIGRNGISGNYLEQTLLLGISEGVVRILPFCMVAGILFLLFSFAIKAEKGGKERLLWWSAAWCGCAAAIWLFVFFVSVPGELLPTKWSDFDFWPQLLKSKKDALLFFLQNAGTRPQLQAMLYFAECVGYSMAAFIFYFLCFRKKV